MGTQEQEIKRAKNMVWAAAGDYSFDPRFIGLKPDGTADEYLNMVSGLVWKWFHFDAIDSLFTSFSGKNEELFSGLLLIGLEHSVCEKEAPCRPALSELRGLSAAENLLWQKNSSPDTRIALIRRGYFLEITGQDPALPAFEKEVLHAFSFSADMTTEDIVQRTLELLSFYFSWHPSPAHPPKKKTLLHNRHAFRSFRKVRSGFVRIADAGPVSENAGLFRNLHFSSNFLLRHPSPAAEKDTLSYLEACFGKSLYDPWEMTRLDQILCTGSHQNLHLLFTDANPAPAAGSPDTQREIRLYQKNARQQHQKNLAFYRRSLPLHQGSIARLSAKLSNALNAFEQQIDPAARSGALNAGRVWRNLCLHDDRIFFRRQDIPACSFSVDILLDASSSRDNWQEQIAAQAYILAESLTACNIPLQITSFVSIRGYTILRLFRQYEQTGSNKELFGFAAGGNNRDGLALRGVSHLMEASPMPGKILIMLTDACPNDDCPAAEGSPFRRREYADSLAVSDTAREVFALRKKGIRVLGVFMGLESSVKNAAEIFGKDFVKIKDISHFADAVGNILTALILDEAN